MNRGAKHPKRDPVVIDVKPEELEREEKCAPFRQTRRRTSHRDAMLEIAEQFEQMAATGDAIYRAVNSPGFWLGVASRAIRGEGED